MEGHERTAKGAKEAKWDFSGSPASRLIEELFSGSFRVFRVLRGLLFQVPVATEQPGQ
jgi:hypothetical protein